MTATVRLHPSQHTFPVEGRDTVLEAGLKAGYRLEYGCSNGNCGDCKARLVSGEIEQVRPHDYVINEAQRHAGVFLMCANTATSDIEVETFEAEDTTAIREQIITARVRKIEDAGEDVLVLNVKTPRSERLRFLAGQHATVSLGAGGAMGPQKNLPMASCPCDDMRIQFHVPKNPDDAFARHLMDNRDGLDQVLIQGPYGDVILDDDAPNPLVFICAGTGFAPTRSLIEHAMSLDNTDAIHLIWCATPDTGHYMDNLVRSWADAFDGFHASLATLGADETIAQALPRLLGGHPAPLPAGQHPAIVYAIGPNARLEGLQDALDDHLPGLTYYADPLPAGA